MSAPLSLARRSSWPHSFTIGSSEPSIILGFSDDLDQQCLFHLISLRSTLLQLNSNKYTQHQQQQQHQQQYYAQPPSQHYQHQPPPPLQDKQQIGRSQSAFNFLLNKAKAPFSSSTSSTTLNASTSMSSLSAHQEDPFDDTTNHIQYHRQLQQDNTFPHAPPGSAQGRRVPSGGIEKSSRMQQQQQPENTVTSRPGAFSRPSYSEEQQSAVASPTKRSFFGNKNRDRKASTASIKHRYRRSPTSLTARSPKATARISQRATMLSSARASLTSMLDPTSPHPATPQSSFLEYLPYISKTHRLQLIAVGICAHPALRRTSLAVLTISAL